jgi:redox-sensitive bicupin YhaK (pirin superfamily)
MSLDQKTVKIILLDFHPHPHRGIETVTYMLAGDFEHKDSTGGEGRMTAGDVQWMKTGSGIIHSEMPAMKEGKASWVSTCGLTCQQN